MASKAYEIAFKLGAKLDKGYNDTFQKAEAIANNTAGKIAKTAEKIDNKYTDAFQRVEETASRTVGKIVKVAAAIGGSILSAGAIKDSVDKAISFESAMANVAKVVDGLKDNIGKATEAYAVMSNKLLDMTAFLPMTANELAQITAAAGQASIASGDLVKFTETAAKMGIAFDVTADQAGEWMALWRTSFNLSQSEVTTLADQINYLSNTSTENASKLSEVVSRIGSLAEISGLSAAEVAAIGASMTGVTAEISATGIKNMMKAMNVGSAATDKQNKVLKKLGFSATEMAKRMQVDAKGAILDLLAAFEKLPDAERSSALTQFFGSESVAAIAPLLANLDNLRGQFEKVGDASLYAGSMESEFASRAATTENKILLAKNALDRLQISLGNLFLPVVSEGANHAADAISNLTSKVPFAANKMETFLKNMWKSAEPLFSWIKTNPTVIPKFIAAIGAAVYSHKVIDGVKGTSEAIKALYVTMTANPVALTLTVLAGAIAYIAITTAETNRKLKKENLAAHFGNISMSLNELEDVAKRIVRTNNLNKLSESLNALSDMEQFERSMDEAVAQLNKYNWKISIGLTLTENEKENYKQSITSFISNAQELLVQKQYAINLSLDVLTDDNETGQKIRDSVNSFYLKNQEELASLGTKLQDAVNNAFEDGFLDINEQKAITSIQKQMADITDAIAKSQFEAKIEVMGMGFDGTVLTGESFKALQEEINNEVLLAQEQYQEALTLNIANAKVMLDQKAISLSEYNTIVNEFKRNYMEDIGELELKATNFQFDTILKAYKDELGNVMPEFAELLSSSIDAAVSEYNQTGIWANAELNFVDAITSFKGLDKATKANLSDLFKNLEPSLDELKKLAQMYEETGQSVPESLSKGIMDMSVLGALVTNGEHMYTLLGSSLGSDNSEYTNMLTNLNEQGANIPNELLAGVKLGYPRLDEGSADMANRFLIGAERTLSKGLQVVIPIRTGLSDSKVASRNPTANINIPQYANGSNYTADTFIAGENGAELITGSKGRKVFTAAETGNIFNNFMNLSGLVSEKESGSLRNLFNPSESQGLVERLKTIQTSNVKNNTPITLQFNNEIKIDGTNKSDSDIKRLLTEALSDIPDSIKDIINNILDEREYREERLSNA